MFTGAYRCLQVLIGAYRCLQVGTGGRCLVIFKSAKVFLNVYRVKIVRTIFVDDC